MNVTRSYMRFSSTIWPLSHRATVQKSTSNDLPVGGISSSSGPFIGPFMVPVNLKDAAAAVGNRAGVIRTLDTSSDLNANLVRFGTGQGIGEHVNDEVGVIVLGVSGSGSLRWIERTTLCRPGC